jgi:signal transduction histidine kinase
VLTGSRKAFYLIVAGILVVLVSTVIFSFFRDRLTSEKRFVAQISRNIDQVISRARSEQNDLEKIINETDLSDFSGFNYRFSFPFYVFRNGSLFFWSDHSVVPEYESLADDFNYAYREISGSSYLVIKKQVTRDTDKFEFITLVYLNKKYEISNQYLQSGLNPEIFRHPQLTLFPSADKSNRISADDGTFLFSVEFYPGYRPDAGIYEYLLLFFLLTGLGLTITGIIFQTIYFREIARHGTALVFLTLSLIAIRMIMVITEFPYTLVEIPVFDPLHYASSFYNASLGDLLLNMLTVLAIIGFLFSVYNKKSLYKVFYLAGRKVSFLYSFVLAIVNIFLVLIMFRLVGSLSQHSQWNADITADLDYPFLKIFSYSLYFLASIIFLMAVYINNSIFFRLLRFQKLQIAVTQLAGGLIFLLIAFLLGFNLYMLVLFALGFVMIISALGIRGLFNRLRYKTFVFVLICTIICALSGSISVFREVHKKNEVERDRFAFQLLEDRDIMTEYFIAEAARNINGDVFIQNRLFSPFASKDIIEQKILKTYLNNYLEKFDVNILLFNSQGLPLNSPSGLKYDDIKSQFALDRYRTEYDGLYYYQQERPVLSRRYLSFIPIDRYDQVAGYIVLVLKLKKVIRNTVYPRLLLDERFLTGYYDDLYNYAIFNGNLLSYTSGDFNYQKDFNGNWLNGTELFASGIAKSGFRHRGYHGTKNKMLVVTWQEYPVSYALANFSFIFLIQVFGLLTLLTIYYIYFILKGREMNYLTRIQLFVNLAFFIPLVIISLITISRISRDYSLEEQDIFLKKAESTGVNLGPVLEQYIENRIGREELYNQVSDIAGLTESDINIYGVDFQRGKLIATSQPMVFEKKLISNYINPRALVRITGSSYTSMILNENIGKLNYKSAFVAVNSTQSGDLLGILSVPFFRSQASIERRIINLIVSVINTFTLIFIGFLFISYFISTYLVFPLKQMIYRIRRTTLTGNNEPIDYYSPDEIGQLVEAYNGMLIKLEQNKKALAQSEKEAGWREMAKQVAHEIKNPLTPMKLTLQHLKMKMESSGKGEKNIYEKSIDSMLLNIETLSNIADSFSNYAKMPVPAIARFDISGLLKQVAGLYINNDQAKISFAQPNEKIFIKGDEYWMGRAFSNLIINSIQAVEGRESAEVNVCMQQNNGRVNISVADNGKGIPDSIRDRIFMPNFSTKFTGSGIGLAVARRAVEHAGGKIWFESEENKGATFFIELPVED